MPKVVNSDKGARARDSEQELGRTLPGLRRIFWKMKKQQEPVREEAGAAAAVCL